MDNSNNYMRVLYEYNKEVTKNKSFLNMLFGMAYMYSLKIDKINNELDKMEREEKEGEKYESLCKQEDMYYHGLYSLTMLIRELNLRGEYSMYCKEMEKMNNE